MQGGSDIASYCKARLQQGVMGPLSVTLEKLLIADAMAGEGVLDMYTHYPYTCQYS